MIIDRYPPLDLFALIPALTLEMDPLLAQIDQLLDDPALLSLVRADLERRSPHSASRGRHGTPVEVIVRLLVVRRLYDWSFEDTEHFVADSLVLRQFCRLYAQRVPDDTTLIRWAGCIRPATIEALNARLVQAARTRGVTRGRKLRLDTTVVETVIHYPSDSTLLADGVRVLSRLVDRARQFINGPAALFRSRVRSARRAAQQIGASTRKRGASGAPLRQRVYRRLLGIARAMVRQSEAVAARLTDETAAHLRTALAQTCALTCRVVQQTTRRLAGDQVPAQDKVVSIFEPHTAIIRRDKPRAQTEFGHKLLLGECEGGIIAQYGVLCGNAADAPELVPSVDRHRTQFGRAPHLVATDRGFWRAACEEQLRERGVRRVAIPRAGHVDAERRRYERSRWFRQAQRFRAGGEGRISVANRRGHLGRCRDHGADGFERWVGWGVIVNNLQATAAHSLGAPA